MGRQWNKLWWWVAGLAACLLLSSHVMASSPGEHAEVRVIIDVSGSMRHNDPDQLAAEALELLVSLVPGGARAGVWTFGERVSNPLPARPVDPEWRASARALAPRLVDYEQHTDIESAVRQVAAAEPSAARVHLLLLTDGVIDLPAWRGRKPDVDLASREALLDEFAPLLAKEKVVVHGIAFSEEADLDLVERLAQVTGGLSALVVEPDALLGAFLDIVDGIYPSDQVPVTDRRFVIEPGLRGFSALLFRSEEAATLVGPGGERYSQASPPAGAEWRSESRYDFVQVPDPQPGQWRLEGETGHKSRITLDTPLRLQTSGVSSTLYLGFDVPVEAWLDRDNEVVEADALPAHLRLTAELRSEAGSVQSAVVLSQSESRFKGTLPAPALGGSANFTVRAEGQGFRRQRSQAVNVLPAVFARHDAANGQVVLTAEHPQLDHHNTRLYGQLQGVLLDAQPQAERRWVMPLPELDTLMSVPLILRGEVSLEGETHELQLPRLVLFPSAATAIDQVDDVAALEVVRFHEELAPLREPGETPRTLPQPVERAVQQVQALPRLAQERWGEWRPVLVEPLAAASRNPRQVVPALAAGLLAVVLALVMWRIVSRRRRTGSREEPHV